MLECQLCEYLKHLAGDKITKCDFTGHVFIGQQGFDLARYPCSNRTYEEYLQSRTSAALRPVSQEGEKLRKSILRGDDWRLLYRRRHPSLAFARRAL